jgi:putative SOS response-associated peptidase YedK
MRGRYTLRHPERVLSPEQILEQIDYRRRRQGQGEDPEVVRRRRFNIAPSQPILVVGPDANGQRVTRIAAWGFPPKWLQADLRAPINARAETVATMPMFRQGFRRGRCLVPADGW